jgi:hypothetical protein
MSTETTTTATTTAPNTGAAAATPAAPASAPATTATPAAETPEGDKPKSEAWAKLRTAEERTRREREETRAAAKKIEEERAEIAKLRADIDNAKKSLSLDGFDGDPLRFIEHHRIDYDDLTRRMLNRPVKRNGQPQANPEIDALKKELEALKAEGANERKQREERAQEHAWGQVVSAFETEIAPPSEGDHAFELVHHEYRADPGFITDTLRAMAQQQPNLTVAQAAALLEKHFEEQTKARLGLRKVRAFASVEADAPKPSDQQAQQAKTGQQASADGPRTLSAMDSSERAEGAPPKPLHEMTLRERREWEKRSEARAAEAWGSRQ